MAERILVPLDGSSLGEAALEYLNTFIANTCPEKKVTVILFHVVFSPSQHLGEYYDVDAYGAGSLYSTPGGTEPLDKLMKNAQLYLARAAKKISSRYAEVKTEVAEGNDPAVEIIKKEVELECDLVVMSTHGRSGLSRWAFGSVTDKVLRGGSAPVLMVRAQDT